MSFWIGSTFLMVSSLLYFYQKRVFTLAKDYLVFILLNYLGSSFSIPQIDAIHLVGNVFYVTYWHNERKYNLFFPIQEEVKSKLKGKDVYLTINDDFKSLLQEPGVPYLIKPCDFGENATINLYSEDDESIIHFTKDQKIELSSHT